MTTLAAAGYISNSARTQAEGKTFFEQVLSVLKETVGGISVGSLTIASDAVTPPANACFFRLFNELGAANDDLKTINTTNIRDGQWVVFTAGDAAQTPRIFHGAGGAGQILLAKDTHISLTTKSVVVLRYDAAATAFREVFHSEDLDNPVGSPAARVYATPPTTTGPATIRQLTREHLGTILDQVLGWKTFVTKVLASDVLSPAATDSVLIKVDAESGTADDLKFIDTTNLSTRLVLLMAASGDTIIVKHNASGATGSQRVIKTADATDVELSGDKILAVVWDTDNVFKEVARAGFAAGGDDANSLLFGGRGERRVLAVPGAPTVTPQGTSGSTTWAYKIVAKDNQGDITAASAAGQTTTGNGTLNSSNFNRLTWTAVAGAKAYDVYRTTAGGTPSSTGKIATVTTTTYDDTGAAGDSAAAPTVTTLVGEHWHPGDFATDSALSVKRFRLHVEGNVAFNHNVTIETEITGGKGSTAPNAPAQAGGGLGPGQNSWILSSSPSGGGGGGHGGRGGKGGGWNGDRGGPGGQAYSIEHVLAGSSGGGGSFWTTDSGDGGNGGGSFYVEARGNITVNANITGNGGTGGAATGTSSAAGGGGSGAGIDMRCTGTWTLTAGKTISANGGAGGNSSSGRGGGGGGGGIVFVRSGGAATTDGTVTVSGGAAGTSGGGGGSGDVAATAGEAGVVDIRGNTSYSARTAP